MQLITNKDGIPFDIDAIITDLNGKAEVDLVNVNDSGTSRGAGWAMPSVKSGARVDLSLGATDSSYQAPANGFFALGMISSAANQFVGIGTRRSQDAKFHTQVNNAVAAQNWVCALFPVLKDEVVNVDYTCPIENLLYFRFIYAQGSENEVS